MSEKWVPEAIAQQEEYLKRIRPCEGVRFRSHSWAQSESHPGVEVETCQNCGVTRTDKDYQTLKQNTD